MQSETYLTPTSQLAYGEVTQDLCLSLIMPVEILYKTESFHNSVKLDIRQFDLLYLTTKILLNKLTKLLLTDVHMEV